MPKPDEIHEFLEVFLPVLLNVATGLILGYLALMVLFFRFDCWKRKAWEQTMMNIVTALSGDQLMVARPGYSPIPVVSHISDPSVNRSLRLSVRLARLFRIGTRTIDMLRPGGTAVIVLFTAWILVSFLLTLGVLSSDSWSSEIRAISGVLGALITAITGMQYILLNHLKEHATGLGEQPARTLRSVCLCAESVTIRPEQCFRFSSNSIFDAMLETNRTGPNGRLEDATVYLFVSIKSRRFSSEVMQFFFDYIADKFSGHCVVLVDKPYEENIFVTHTGYRRNEELAKLSQVRIERANFVKNAYDSSVMKGKGRELSFTSWQSLRESVDTKLREEVWNALSVENRGEFYYDAVTEAVNSVKAEPGDAERFLGFFREELPVLFQVYYGTGDVVDAYPGHNSPLIWKLEHGCYRTELPRTTQLAQERPLRYLRIRTQ